MSLQSQELAEDLQAGEIWCIDKAFTQDEQFSTRKIPHSGGCERPKMDGKAATGGKRPFQLTAHSPAPGVRRHSGSAAYNDDLTRQLTHTGRPHCCYNHFLSW